MRGSCRVNVNNLDGSVKDFERQRDIFIGRFLFYPEKWYEPPGTPKAGRNAGLHVFMNPLKKIKHLKPRPKQAVTDSLEIPNLAQPAPSPLRERDRVRVLGAVLSIPPHSVSLPRGGERTSFYVTCSFSATACCAGMT